MATDPVCGMEVDPEAAPASTFFEGKMVYFCCVECKRKFEEDPARYVPVPSAGARE